jgi:signal transduction histidine kinase/CheY-like chemotaxis protein
VASGLTAAITDFDGLPVAAGVAELDGTLIAVNRAGTRLFARSTTELLGKKVWQLAPGVEHIWPDIVATLLRDGETRGEITIATPEGPRDIQYIGALRSYETRTLIVGIAVDLHTPIRAANEADQLAKQRVEALGLVAGGIAHDFNNQLVAVLAEASAAREDPTLGDSARDAFRRVEAAANRMAQLTRQLLAYAGRGRIVTEVLDPDQLVSELREQLMRLVRADAQLDVSLGAGVAVEADRSMLQQVIVNIVANASESLRAEGRITITTRVDDGWWALDVADTGVGMEPKTIERIFDPFFTTKPAHHGLGLSAVSGIVRRLGGELNVESRPGGGSTFQIRLRAVPAIAVSRTRTASTGPRGARLVGARVLVADDEPSVRMTICRLLERRGATVIAAGDGAEAEARLREGAYTFVLLDVMMPKLTGYQLLPVVRSAQPSARVMLMSGYTEAARGAGGDEPDAFLEKPFTAGGLDHAVDRLLGRD